MRVKLRKAAGGVNARDRFSGEMRPATVFTLGAIDESGKAKAVDRCPEVQYHSFDMPFRNESELRPPCLVVGITVLRMLSLGVNVFAKSIFTAALRGLPRRAVLCFVFLGQGITWGQTPVDLTAQPKISSRDGALITVTGNAGGNGTIISVEYPNGEGGGNVAFKVDAFGGPLGRLTFLAKGNAGNWRIGVRGPTKSPSAPSISFPLVSEAGEAYSLDFVSIAKKAMNAENSIQYPITEIVFGFRYKDRQKDVVELSDLILHPGE